MEGEEYHDFSWAAPSRFSRTLLSPKLFKLFFHAGYTSLIPFLPMYYRFLGLTAFQSGMLGSLRSLVSCWSSFLWCIVSEKIAKRKCFIVVLLLTGIVLNVSLSFVHNPEANFMDYSCPDVGVSKNSSRLATGNISFQVRSASDDGKRSIRSNIALRSEASVVLLNGTAGIHELALSRSKNTGQNKSGSLFGFQLDALFRNLLLVTACAEIFMSPVKTIMDSVFADFLHFSNGSVGQSKTWNFLGDLFGAGLVILIIGHYQCSFSLSNSFYLHFYIFSFLCGLAFVFASLLHVYEPKTSMNYRFGRTCNYICCNVQTLSIMSIMVALGTAESLMSNFMMWYLQDINASITVMGLMIAVGVFSELIMSCLSKYVIRIFGYQSVFALALMAYGGHFLAFSYITNQWLVLPVQLLQGISMTCVWAATSAYCSEVAPIGMERTLNGVISIAYWGIGHGFGGIGIALLYYQYGPTVVFRCAAGICVVYTLLYVLLQCLIKMPGDSHMGRNMKEYHQIIYDERNCRISHKGDWLLEALEAEDEEEHFSR